MTLVVLVWVGVSSAQGVVSRAQGMPARPWLNRSLSPEQRGPFKRLVSFRKVDLMFGASQQVTPSSSPAPCPSVQPGPAWVCVNGGWLPPGHPGIPTAPGTTPNPALPGAPSNSPASCPSIQPGPDWVCVDDGWLPPDHPLVVIDEIEETEDIDEPLTPASPSSAAPSTCSTTVPGADWVCVNGGWLPPGHPLLNPESLQPASVHQLVMVDSGYAALVRESLRRGEPQFQPALAALEADADRALTLAPVSVMDKTVTPPSGDKHDYMSQAPYWWPDPSEPDGKPYVRRDGKRNPEIDRITDRQDIGVLGRAVSSLALAFYFTGREEYAEQAARLVRVWFLDPATRMNPDLEFAQGIPGIANGRSAGIIESRWLADIVGAVTVLQGSPAWTVSDDQALRDWMRAFLTWLLESSKGRTQAGRGNNQETWYDVQVVALALYTGQTDVARTTLERAKTAIAQQFQPDGRQPRELERTNAWDYSIFNLTAFLALAALGDRAGVDLWNHSTADGRSLRQGIEFLIPFATGEKPFPYEQIGGFRPSVLHPVLRRAAVGFNEPRYREIARQIGGETRRLELTLP